MSCSHLDGAVQHAQEPEHSAGGALILFDEGDGAGACGEDPLLHKRQHVVLLFQLLHQHVLHVHLPETWTIWSLIWPAPLRRHSRLKMTAHLFLESFSSFITSSSCFISLPKDDWSLELPCPSRETLTEPASVSSFPESLSPNVPL